MSEKTIALLGQPNSGKSTLFNGLTGSRQHVGNWPGKTVERKDGSFVHKDTTYKIIDLPGTYMKWTVRIALYYVLTALIMATIAYHVGLVIF